MSVAPLPARTALQQGRYIVQRPLGQGGFGMVYLAHDRDGRPVAIKECLDGQRVIRAADGLGVKTRADQPRAAREHAHQCQRAREEAALFRRPSLQHRNLVPLTDAFDEHGTTYLVMPYIDGLPLHEAAQSRHSREPAWVLDVLGQIVEVLDLLHQHGLIHRDLKPDNVLITQDASGRSRPIVLDTGATRGFRERAVIHTGIVTDFGPPEIVSQTDARLYGEAGPASDCFALAGMAHLLLTGSKPVGWSQRVARTNRTGGVDPLMCPAGLDSAVWSVLKRSLSLPTALRHATAREFLSDLTAALRPGQTVSSRAASAAPGDQPAKSAEVRPPSAVRAVAGPRSALPAPGPAWLGWLGASAAQGLGVLLSFALWPMPMSAVCSLLWLLLNWGLAIGLVRQGVGLSWACFPGLNGWIWWRARRGST